MKSDKVANKSNINTFDNTLENANQNLSQFNSRNVADYSLVTYDPQNLTEIPNLAYEYLNNISGYDLISDEQNSVISSDDNETKTRKIKKDKVISIYSSKNSSQKRFVLNKKLLSNYERKTSKVNTSLNRHYSVKTNPSMFIFSNSYIVSSKTRKTNSSTKIHNNVFNYKDKDKNQKLHKCISQNFKENQSSKSRSASRKYQTVSNHKSKKHASSKNSKSKEISLTSYRLYTKFSHFYLLKNY
jgi:CHASE3 domain sensor protein